LIAALFMLMIVTVIVGESRSAGEGRQRDDETASPAPADTAIVALPASPKCRADARIHYRDGLSAMREANWEIANIAFEKPCSPIRVPEAQLRRAMTARPTSRSSPSGSIFAWSRAARRLERARSRTLRFALAVGHSRAADRDVAGRISTRASSGSRGRGAFC